MPKYKNRNLFFPVWNYAHYADPHKAAMKAIHRMYADEPDLEALFIGQVLDMMQAEIWQEQEAAAGQRLEKALFKG